MAVVNTPAVGYKDYLMSPFKTHTYKLILMATGFVFNGATHKKYSDVSASEVAAGNGYVQNSIILTLDGVVISGNLVVATFEDALVSASGGDIELSGAIIYDDSVTDKLIVNNISVGAEVILDGTSYLFDNIKATM